MIIKIREGERRGEKGRGEKRRGEERRVRRGNVPLLLTTKQLLH